MSGQKILIGALGLAIVVLLFSFGINKTESPANLGGIVKEFTNTEVINTSSSVGIAGVTVITNASNSGKWFRISNLVKDVDVYCSLGTTAATGTGMYLSINSSTENFFEMYGVGGPVSCKADASGAKVSSTVGVIYVGQ